MKYLERLRFDQIYHVYNKAVNQNELFRENDNYEYFLSLYEKYVSPIAETYSWVLMKNHFHFLIRIREEEEITKRVGAPRDLHLYFSDFFNAYTKSYNAWYDRKGSLFERRFKRKSVLDSDYFRDVLIYIHNNPVHHNVVEDSIDYPWSSYLVPTVIESPVLRGNSLVGTFNKMAKFRTDSTSCPGSDKHSTENRDLDPHDFFD